MNSDKKILNKTELDQALLAYGRKTYAHLLSEYNDEALALDAVKSVLLEMYTAMKSTGSTDPLEAMMYSQGKKYQNELIKDTAGEELNLLLKNIVSDNDACSPSLSSAPLSDKKPKPVMEPPAEPADTVCFAEAPEPVHSPQHKGALGSTILIVFLILLIVVSLWFIVGLSMSMGFIPKLDMGYEWFNHNITFLF